MKNAYLRFLRLLEAADAPSVDLTAQKLLEVFALKHHEGKPSTVTEAMELSAIASPATIHRKITDLLDAELISLEHQGANRRTKYIHPTKKADQQFVKLAKFMSLANN